MHVIKQPRKTDLETLEKVQRRATKNLPKLSHLKYSDRLKNVSYLVPTLHYRRIRGDKVETYKILTGKYDMVAVTNLSIAATVITRGNDLRLQKNRTRYDLRKFFFTNRLVNMWNSLPNIVVHAESTDIFKKRLDKFWSNQEVICNYHFEI